MGMSGRRISRLIFINTFRQKGISLFTLSDVRKIFPIGKENTLKHLIRRLKKEKIIERIAKEKYLFLHAQSQPSDFAIANFLVVPSFISLESALSYYGILAQFPYRISSLALAKSKHIAVGEKNFVYAKIKPEYFKDFVKIDDFLIADRRKAILDYLYFIYKGLRPKSSLSDLSQFLSQKKIKDYLYQEADPKFINFLKKYVKL